MSFYVYVITDAKNTKFTVGVTKNLFKRVHDLKNSKEGKALTDNLNKLIYFEQHISYVEAMKREKEIADWRIEYLRQIITLQNPKMEDLYSKIH